MALGHFLQDDSSRQQLLMIPYDHQVTSKISSNENSKNQQYIITLTILN